MKLHIGNKMRAWYFVELLHLQHILPTKKRMTANVQAKYQMYPHMYEHEISYFGASHCRWGSCRTCEWVKTRNLQAIKPTVIRLHRKASGFTLLKCVVWYTESLHVNYTIGISLADWIKTSLLEGVYSTGHPIGKFSNR